MAALAALRIGSGNLEVRLTDAEIDRVLQTATQFKDPANPGCLDAGHAVGDPMIEHWQVPVDRPYGRNKSSVVTGPIRGICWRPAEQAEACTPKGCLIPQGI